MISLVLNNQRSQLLEDADYDGHSLSMLQKIADALNQKVEIKFSAIAPWVKFGVVAVLVFSKLRVIAQNLDVEMLKNKAIAITA